MKTAYIDFGDITKIQNEVMQIISNWVKTKKTPVPRKAVIDEMEKKGVKSYNTVDALNSLLRKGYIRRTYASYQNKTFYVQLRTI